MQELLLRTVPILSAASISTYIIYKNIGIVESQSLQSSSSNSQSFETPEKYLKSMFEINNKTNNNTTNVEPQLKQMLYSSESIINKLSKNANIIYTKNNNIITHYHTNQYNANTPIEDTFDVRLIPNTKNLQGSLFGVYDGHSGDDCSKFCRDELVYFISIYFHSSLHFDHILIV